MILNLKGFTLIELLVVIAIIGVLSSVILVALSTARYKSLDARRAADIKEIQKAVELYYDAYGHYPNSANNWASFDAPTYTGTAISNPNASSITAALSNYINEPGDPDRVSQADGGYLYKGSGSSYCVLFYRTPYNMKDFQPSLIPSTRCATVTDQGGCLKADGSATANAIYVGVGTFAAGC